jgi:hypothetical protein
MSPASTEFDTILRSPQNGRARAAKLNLGLRLRNIIKSLSDNSMRNYFNLTIVMGGWSNDRLHAYASDMQDGRFQCRFYALQRQHKE